MHFTYRARDRYMKERAHGVTPVLGGKAESINTTRERERAAAGSPLTGTVGRLNVASAVIHTYRNVLL